MKYMIQIGTELYGYNNPAILKIDIKLHLNDPSQCVIFKQVTGLMVTKYETISYETLMADVKQYHKEIHEGGSK